jgi:hypothetical protein
MVGVVSFISYPIPTSRIEAESCCCYWMSHGGSRHQYRLKVEVLLVVAVIVRNAVETEDGSFELNW